MNINDLKTGMKVVLQNGGEYIIFTNFQHEASNDAVVLLSNEGNNWLSVDSYLDDLTCTDYQDLDIIEVYKPIHIYDVGNFFGSENLENGWRLIWERKEDNSKILENLIVDLEKQLKNAKDMLHNLA